ncbi:MAG TPA: TetR/AcrR family transcriptional regulator [Sphingobium sp.]
MAIKIEDCSDFRPVFLKKTAASKIFETARDLFYKRGIRAVGVDEIVCEAGVTKPSLYRAYKSKDDLVVACLEERSREDRAELDSAIAAAGPCPRDRLRAVARHFSDKIKCPEFRGCAISNVAVEMPESGHPGRAIVESCKTNLRALIGDLTRALDIAEPDALADGLILVIEGAMTSHHIFGSQGPALSLMSTCETLTESYLKHPVR